MLKKIIKWLLPQKGMNFLRLKLNHYRLKKEFKTTFLYDLKRYSKYSDSLGKDTEPNLIGKIIREYHVIEKGLTMPETRLEFGKELVLNLCKDCLQYIEKYGKDEIQLIHAIGVTFEYEDFHRKRNHKIDDEIVYWIECLRQKDTAAIICSQREVTKKEYFKHIESAFPEFSNSRSSVRNYSNEEIPLKCIIEALDIAKNTPSACNRQCWRTHVFSNKLQINEILKVQGGNRGFGHLANKLIVITSEIGVFTNVSERNEAFIDGGMYAMNLLYSIHYQRIAACILNCSNTIEKDKELRTLCQIRDSEVFIAMIACGMAPETFKIASSKRYEIEHTQTTFF